MNATFNLLGTVIFDHDNPKEQSLIIKNLVSDIEKEYPLEHGLVISHDGKRIPARSFLSTENAQELQDARMNKQYISFMLSRTELEKAQQLFLIP
ncbi:hypothetical protein RKD55_004569 [Rossellomorea marisflavi]